MVVTAHAVALHGHPLRAAADRGAAATLDVVVRDDPRELRPSTTGGRPGATQVLVPATLRAAETGGGRWSSGGRVLLIAPGEEWSTLLPGQPVTADGLLAPATRDDLTVAVLRVRGGPPGRRAGAVVAERRGHVARRAAQRRGGPPRGGCRAVAGPRGRRRPRPADGGARRLPYRRPDPSDGRVGQQSRDRRRCRAGVAAAAPCRPAARGRPQRGGVARLRRARPAVAERAAGRGDGRRGAAGPRARPPTIGRARPRRGRARPADR